jgi:hypothetical protein
VVWQTRLVCVSCIGICRTGAPIGGAGQYQVLCQRMHVSTASGERCCCLSEKASCMHAGCTGMMICNLMWLLVLQLYCYHCNGGWPGRYLYLTILGCSRCQGCSDQLPLKLAGSPGGRVHHRPAGRQETWKCMLVSRVQKRAVPAWRCRNLWC